MIISLWPIKLTFNLITLRRFVYMILLLFEISESAEMSVIQITISEVGISLTNCELNTPSFGGTQGITFFFRILFVCKTLNSVCIVRITKSVFMKKFNMNIIVCAFFGCLYCITVLLDIVILVVEISMCAFRQCFIWITIACSCVHCPAFASFVCTPLIKSYRFVKSA